MKTLRRQRLAAALCLQASLSVAGLAGQAPAQPPAGRGAPPAAIRNPVEGDPAAIRAGGEGYRRRCASCHGPDASGTALGSNLTGIWSTRLTDVQIFQTVRRGVSNTLLSHSFGPDEDIWQILAFLRTLNTGSVGSRQAGDAEHGRSVFDSQCLGCHEVTGRGGRLGPPLSQVGALRSPPFLAHKIRHASAYFMSVYQGGFVLDGYQPVVVITRDGQRIRGVKKNEDAFSIQIMDAGERVQGYVKADVRQVVNDTTSLMPDFGPDRLTDSELGDLLAYLGALGLDR